MNWVNVTGWIALAVLLGSLIGCIGYTLDGWRGLLWFVKWLLVVFCFGAALVASIAMIAYGG